MLAVKVNGQVTGDGQLLVELPKGMEPGPVEVIVLQDPGHRHFRGKEAGRRETIHPAFGMWADRAEIQDSAAFAEDLRRRL